jgi:hypothetical protein
LEVSFNVLAGLAEIDVGVFQTLVLLKTAERTIVLQTLLGEALMRTFYVISQSAFAPGGVLSGNELP